MAKKRIFVPIVGQGSIVHIIRSGILNKMKNFCEPVVGILWNDDALMEELKLNNFEVYIIPAFSASSEYKNIRSKINRWYQKNILKTPSTKIQENYLGQFLPFSNQIIKKIRILILNIKSTFLPHFVNDLIALENEMLQNEAIWKQYSDWLSSLKLNGLYTVTPFLIEIELIARILKQPSFPIIASIHSFDNITKRGWPAIFFDHYIVWNIYNKKELMRINTKFTDSNISIAGAPQFDFHFNESLSLAKSEWLKQTGLPSEKKIILYSGGSINLFPNEPQYLKHLNEAIQNKEIEDDCVILFRSHPLDRLSRWKEYVGESPYIIYDQAPSGKEKMDYSNVTHNDIEKLLATLKYTDVHINLCSTMTVDGSAFLKPQIGPAYDEIVNKNKVYLLKQMYSQEHFIPILKTNGIQLAESRKEMIHFVNGALKNPDRQINEIPKCVKEIITYTDGKSADRVINILNKIFAE